MESHDTWVAQESIEVRNVLTTRRLPRRAWKPWKTLRGADRTALSEFFEQDYHYLHLRSYFFSGSAYPVSDAERVQGRKERRCAES